MVPHWIVGLYSSARMLISHSKKMANFLSFFVGDLIFYAGWCDFVTILDRNIKRKS